MRPRENIAPFDTITVANDAEWQARKDWYRKLHSGGWVGISWPKVYGGRDAPALHAMVFHEELGRVHAPLPYIGAGAALVGPTLIQWGTEKQKQRFIPKILSGEETWCQGYSEPNAGSDLASLQTRAVDHGDFFMLEGSKIWTSGAQWADWMYLLARTDPTAPKHKGISCFYLDMKSPGIELRPLVTMAGHRHFNQVFFDKVRVPRKNLVGP